MRKLLAMLLLLILFYGTCVCLLATVTYCIINHLQFVNLFVVKKNNRNAFTPKATLTSLQLVVCGRKLP